jgi:hypothetical protein
VLFSPPTVEAAQVLRAEAAALTLYELIPS